MAGGSHYYSGWPLYDLTQPSNEISGPINLEYPGIPIKAEKFAASQALSFQIAYKRTREMRY